MTKKLSPEQIAEMSEDCQCSCKELEQYKAWWERDSAALGKSLNEVSSLRAVREESRAAIEQLHAAVKTAQELAARRLMEVERLEAARKHWHEKWNEALTELDGYRTAEFRKNWNALNAPEPCERHRWKPGMWNVYYVRSDGQERPALSAETAEGAANALRQDAADLVRVIESEGASRDASSEPLQGASFPMSNERSHELAEWLRNNWAGHSMMMEIASMLQKDRGCPMANKYTFRSLGMLGQMYDPIGMEVNFPNDTEFYLASDIASSAQRT